MMRLVLFVSLASCTWAFSPVVVSRQGRRRPTTFFSSTSANDFFVDTTTATTRSTFPNAAFSQRSSMSLSSTAVVERVRDSLIRSPTKEESSTLASDNHRKRVAVVDLQERDDASKSTTNLYIQFARRYPFMNNLLIATVKTGAADFMAQTVIGGAALRNLDLSSSVLFMLFGALYSGAFQWLYQVRIFQKIFGKRSVERFTQQSWRQKLRDRAGLQSLAAQTALDLAVMTAVYLPTFYIFKASVFAGSLDNPIDWLRTGWHEYRRYLPKDALDVVRVWLPADLLCFSVPMYLRLPVRHSVAFFWTAYLSFCRGGH